jgi:imidazoleglycerol phosphate dehydratase HisB
MSTRTTTTKGLAKPHKAEAAKKASGSSLNNARTIATEQSGKGMRSSGGVAHTYFGNSRACSTDCKEK